LRNIYLDNCKTYSDISVVIENGIAKALIKTIYQKKMLSTLLKKIGMMIGMKLQYILQIRNYNN